MVDDLPPPPVPGDLEDTERAVKAIRAACEAVLKAEAELTALDEKVGDGDAGTTLAAGAKAVLEARDAGLPKGRRASPRPSRAPSRTPWAGLLVCYITWA